LWQVGYSEVDSCNLRLHSGGVDISGIRGFTINRPCADIRFWDALAGLLQAGNFVLYFPGIRAPIVGRPAVSEHLPGNMIASLGHPLCIATGQEILDEIHAA
jgi:hypothetical protein